MDLEKIEIPKIFFKNSAFLNPKTPNFYYIVTPIFFKPFTGRIVNYPVDEDAFWIKMERPKTLTLSKKNQFEKKGIISSWGLWPGTRDDPIFFWPPEKSYFMSFILIPCFFPVINP